jgi:hypothetical protein
MAVTPNELAPKILGNLRILRDVIGTFPIPPHSTNVIITRELMTAFLAAIDVTAIDPITERDYRCDPYAVDLMKVIRKRIYADCIRQIVDGPELLVLQRL